MTSLEFTPHAAITLSNLGGIEVMLNHSNDGVYYRFNYGQDNLQDEEIFESEIQYTQDDEPEAFFTHTHPGDKQPTVRYYLSEAMRIR